MSDTQIYFWDGINGAAESDISIVCDGFTDRLNTLMPVDVVEWIETEIFMESTKVGQEAGRIKLEPFQVAPIKAQLERGVQWVVIIAPEQYGKSFCWRLPKVYQMRFWNGLFVIVYEQADKAREINDREFHPVVEAVQELREQLANGEGKYTKKNYTMRDNIFTFLGAGADITSQRVRAAAGDEVDTWPLLYQKKLSQVANLEKRLRRAMARGEGCLTLCSSPKGTDDDSAIWHCYQETNQGIFTLRCMGCGELTIPSTMIDGKRDPFTKEFHGGLKWETENFVVDPNSIRLECPACHYQHIDDESRDMVEWGDYVFKNSNVWAKHGYLFGSLCSYKRVDGTWLALRWVDIAQKRVDVSRTNSFEERRTYYNSFVGIPLPKKERADDAETTIQSHRSSYEDAEIGCIIGAADTQESPWGWFWIIRGVDENWNTYLIDCGFASSEDELGEVVNGIYLEMPVTLFIVDQGGTNAAGVKRLAKKHRNVWQYKGASKPTELWALSQNKDQRKLLICDATRLQIMVLRLIYEQDDRNNNYWFLPLQEQIEKWREASDELAKSKNYDAKVFDYMEHIISVQPTDGKEGDKYQYWTCKGNERRDYFDCEKMLLVLLGRQQFRNRIERAIQERKPNKEDESKKENERKKKVKTSSFVGKARASGGWSV